MPRIRMEFCDVCLSHWHSTQDCPYVPEAEPGVPKGFHLESIRDDGVIVETMVNPTRPRRK